MIQNRLLSLAALLVLAACPESEDRPRTTDAGPERRDQICRDGQFQCPGDNACIPADWLCDGHADCLGGEDEEQDCPGSGDPDAGSGADAGTETDGGQGGSADAGQSDAGGVAAADGGPQGGDNDAGPGDDDAGPGNDDAGPGNDDAGQGNDDAGQGGDDAGQGGDDHGDDIDDATEVDPQPGQGGEVGAIEQAGDVDYYSFTVGRPGLWTIETRGDSDTHCELFDAEEQPLAEDDDSGEETNCRIIHELAAGPRYYIAIRMADAEEVGGYELWLIAPDAPVVAPRISMNMTEGAPGTIFLARATGLTAGGQATFHLRQPNLEESDVATGNADDEGRLGAQITTFENSPPGVYLLWVQDHQTELVSPPVTFRLVAIEAADDHGDAREDATPLREGQVLDGEIEEERDVDWFSFTTQALGPHRMETIGNADTVCTLYDADGLELESDDDDGDLLNCRIDRDLPFQTRFFLRVTTFLGRTGNYQLSLRGPVDDHGNEIALATAMGNPAPTGIIERPGDEDYFSFQAQIRGSYRFSTSGATDTYCMLVDARGQRVASDDDGGEGNNCDLSHSIDQVGTYYLIVRHFSALSVGAYSTTFRRPIGPVEDDYGNTPETAGLIVPGAEVGASLEEQGDVDHFLFYPRPSGTWIVETMGNLDTTCLLLTEQGERIDSDDDSGTDMNCSFTQDLVAGRGYILAVSGFMDREQGIYTVRTSLVRED